jgi:hypothetical protein
MSRNEGGSTGEEIPLIAVGDIYLDQDTGMTIAEIVSLQRAAESGVADTEARLASLTVTLERQLMACKRRAEHRRLHESWVDAGELYSTPNAIYQFALLMQRMREGDAYAQATVPAAADVRERDLSRPDRRWVLKASLATGVAATGLAAWKGPKLYDRFFYRAKGDMLEARLKQRYGIDVQGLTSSLYDILRHGPRRTELEFTAHDSFQIRAEALTWLEEALAPYPPDLFKRLRVDEVFTGTNIKEDGVSQRGLGMHQIKRTGYRRLAFFMLRNDHENFRRAVDHEVGHVFTKGYISEEEWAVATCGSWGEYARLQQNFTRDAKGVVSADPSFVRGYSIKDYTEDMADVAMFMHEHPQFVIHDDHPHPVMRKKIQVMKGMMDRMSDGRIGKAYWEDLDDGKIDLSYWKEFGGGH